MRLEWEKSEFHIDGGPRIDLDLYRGTDFLGYFPDTPNGYVWHQAGAGGVRLNLSHMTLEEAKAVVEASLLLEGI